MPRFFFDTFLDSAEPDQVGIELAGLDEARSQAIRFAGEMMQYNSDEIWDDDALRIEVWSPRHVLLFVVMVSAINIVPAS